MCDCCPVALCLQILKGWTSQTKIVANGQNFGAIKHAEINNKLSEIGQFHLLRLCLEHTLGVTPSEFGCG